MAQMPADAQRSDDGQWWWDGSQWQPVADQGGAAGAAGAGAGAAPAAAAQPAQGDTGQAAPAATGELSPDGQWRWDGSQWQPTGYTGGETVGTPVQSGGETAGTPGQSGGETAATPGQTGGATVGTPVAGAAGGAGDAAGDAGAAEFGFDNNGLIVQVDQSDNPDNHVVLNANAGTEAVFTICNMSTTKGSATVTIYVDDQQVQTWTSDDIDAGQCQGANVSGCGRHPSGSHTFRAVVAPGHSGNGEATNTVDIEDS